MPLTEQILLEHLSGKNTIATYIQRPNSTVKYMVIDIDISKKILLQYERESDTYHEYLKKAWDKALEVCRLLRSCGLQGYVEYSGCRGYHVWLLFSEWVPVRYVNMFCDMIERRISEGMEAEINFEFFPNKTRVRSGKFGQAMKLPYGIHSKTGERSCFLDENFGKAVELNSFLDNMAKCSLSTLKKILALNCGQKGNIEEKVVDMDLTVFGELSENISAILENCSLMRYLCQKAQKTGYLTHFERMSVLYVFGHMGEDGEQFVHQVMGYTLNYQHNTTERFIRKIPEKPVSCLKLREQYKQITAEYGCNCSFQRSKNCYPSPVLHAILLSNGLQNDITIPTSRTMSKEKEKLVLNELNIHKKAQELAGKILEMKKQKRGIDASILKVEKELERIYDNAGVDCLEIEMGMLVRRRIECGYEWLIEI